jgi:Fe(3+) dicitrate transport protein
MMIMSTRRALSRPFFALFWFVLILAATSEPAAQSRASQVEGRIVDSLGGVIPGATVRLVPQGPGMIPREVATDAEGRFVFADTAPGLYDLTAEAPGFSVTQQTLRLSTRPSSVELVLRPGALTEDLTVFGARIAGSEEVRRAIPGAVDILTSDTLESSHVFTTSEALRKVPGVVVRDEEGFGLRPNIAVRGLNPTRSTKVLLLEDGVPTAYAPYGDNASYYHPPIDRFERVEVLKGSSQIGYGPVTLGAVINYITPEPPRRSSASLGLAGGDHGYFEGDFGAGGTYGGTGLWVSVLRKQGDGARDNVHSDLNDVNVKLTQTLTATQNLSVKGNFYGEDSQVTYSGLRADEYAADPRGNPFLNDSFEGRRWSGSGAYRALLGGRVAWTTTVYYQTFDRDWWRQSSNSGQRPNDAADPACGGMANLLTTCGNEGRLRSYRSGGVENRLRTTFAVGSAMQETDAGFRWHTENQDRLQENGAFPTARSGVRVEDNERTTDAWSAFLQQHARWSGLTITPGVRVERVAYTRTNRLTGVSGETTLTEWLPGVGASYALGSSSTVFAGVHRGFSPPRAEDIISNTTGGVVDLDPERSWNYEVGARAAAARGLQVDATFFRLDYENQIIAASIAGGTGAALTNGGETLHQGVEVGISADSLDRMSDVHALYARAALTWLPTATFTGTRFSSVSGSTSVSVSGNRLPYAPEGTATVTLGYRHRLGLDAQIEAQHVSDQFGDDLNTVSGTADGQRGLIPAYTYWNTAVSWRLPMGGSVYLAIKNLLDDTFIVDRVRGILPGSPRLVQVGTTWRF